MRAVPYLPHIPRNLLFYLDSGYRCGIPDYLDFDAEEERREREGSSELAETVTDGENAGGVCFPACNGCANNETA